MTIPAYRYLDFPVAEDVRAQAAAVDERPEHRPPGVALNDGARLAQPHAAAQDLANRELVADERVQVDAARDHVPAVLARRRAGARMTRTPRPRSSSARCPACPTGRCRCRRRAGRPRVPRRRSRERSAAPPRGQPPHRPTRAHRPCRRPTAPRAGEAARARCPQLRAGTRPRLRRARPRVRRRGPRRRRTARRTSRTSRPPARAIHGPGHENVPAPAIVARPSPRPPSHRDTVHPVAGSSSPAGRGRSSKRSSRIVATQARNETVSSGSSDSGSPTSRITRDSRAFCDARQEARGTGVVQHDQRAGEDDQVADAEHVADAEVVDRHRHAQLREVPHGLLERPRGRPSASSRSARV